MGDEGPLQLQSADFLRSLARAGRTKHEASCRKAYDDHGLRIEVPITPLDIGLPKPIPFFKPTDFVKIMALHDKISAQLLGGGSFRDLGEFWARYRIHYPQHPVYSDHPTRLQYCVPILLHADEGRHLKREQIFIFNWQSMLGSGTVVGQQRQTEAERRATQGLNFQGSTFTNRFLLVTLLTLHYRNKKQKHDRRLLTVMNAVVDDFLAWYTDGLEVVHRGAPCRLYGVVLGLKGDWPMLSKLGQLKSHFGRQADTPSDKSAICHLCKAGCQGFPYSDHTVDAAWYQTYLQQRPWTTPSPLMRLPTLPTPEQFYHFDIFHCMHKGLLAELAGSAIDPRLHHMCSALVVRNRARPRFFSWQVVLLDEDAYGEGGDVDCRLDKVYDDLQTFCKDHGLALHMTRLTRTLLHYGRDCEFPCGSLGCMHLIFVNFAFRTVIGLSLGCGSREQTPIACASSSRPSFET